MRKKALFVCTITIFLTTLIALVFAEPQAGSDSGPDVAPLTQVLSPHEPLTRERINQLHNLMSEIRQAETRVTPSISDVGFYDSPGDATDRDIPVGIRTPLILVHGDGSDILSEGHWWQWGRTLDDKERWINYLDAFNADAEFASLYKVYRFVYDSRLSIDENAQNLVTVIDNIDTFTGWEQEDLDAGHFVLLAHSMGGLVARAAMNKQFTEGLDAGEFLGNRVISLITLGTPHHGSPFAVPLWVADSALRGSGISPLEFVLLYTSPIFRQFDAEVGDFDLAWDNYDDAVPLADMAAAPLLFLNIAALVGGGLDQHIESISDPYIAQLNADDRYRDRLVPYAGKNPPRAASVQTLLDVRNLILTGQFDEHDGLGYAANKLAEVIAGDIGEGDEKPYGENDGFVPLASAAFETESIPVTVFDDSDHLSLLDGDPEISAVIQKLVYIAPRRTPWSEIFGGTYDDWLRNAEQASDGGYVAAGGTRSSGLGGSDAWLIKTGTDGGEQWSETFGGIHDDWAHDVFQTGDGGYIIAGGTHSFGLGGSDAWLIKVDANGSEDWSETFGSLHDDSALSVRQAADGGYIIAGGTHSFGLGGSDVWLIKTDANGNEDWSKTFGSLHDDWATCVRQTSDGGYIVAGATYSFGAGGTDMWLIKVDAGGNEEWSETFGGLGDDSANSVEQTSDGGYIVAGATRSFGAGGTDVWLLKTDAGGNEEWSETFGGLHDDSAQSAEQTIEGGYIVAGGTYSFGAGGADMWLLKTDAGGNEEWSETFGGLHDDKGWSIDETVGGGYILAGETTSFGLGDVDAWLIRTDSEGND